MKRILYLVILILVLGSCASRREVVYLQDSNVVPENIYIKYAPKIQQEDLLTITVSAADLKAVLPFNQLNPYQVQSANSTDFAFKPTYLVDNNGEIDFPVIGKLKLGGLSRLEATQVLKTQLTEYIVNPGVNITFANFKITVLGEVNKPGTYNLSQERVTILEALGLAGDMTIKGVRNNVLLVREKNGEKEMHRLNLLTDSIVNSPYFYLAQNDVVYVEPNTSQVRNSRFGQDTNVWISISSLLITITALIVTNIKN
ncbi:polysaccharide biosynthesis/export family protein [Sphingobacterium bovistauri]|uniref:Polysaccharide biosynthesis/export family protein n=1 Tax=Sphingobacterium bovistauri TaxID=2781959 RepID=A0ABS7Z1Q6_9SPHI|nr:polysaccharide biosynthesis/export family protein [Sphingobacterium bovistauri]MCA5004102.1 polysaccharide biosynthesis/export family protein [Sphingobacterium bovistauri]